MTKVEKERLAKIGKTFNAKKYIKNEIEEIRRQVGDKKVLLALSGGVDSSVVAALLIKAIGKQLVCVHVNHGLMRKNESEGVVELFRNGLDANLIYVDATDRFLDLLKDVAEPERKRKIIGAEFIRVFEEEARKLDGIDFLGQGTIYPDIVESGTKTAKMVKSHHNVGGLPDDLQFELVEPLRQLFKDEVRACGVELGLLGKEAQEAMDHSDVIFTKGMGNVETLYGSKYEIYFAFLTKCDLIMEVFQKPFMTPMLVHQK